MSLLSPPPVLRVIRGLGGNGGTFLSRALAAMDRVLLLSETNPASANLFGFELNPIKQIGDHYHQLGLSPYEGNLTELGEPARYGRFIEQLVKDCRDQGYHLILRDYNYADYIGTPFVWRPSLTSSLDAALPGYPMLEILLIRHPASQYASLLAHAELKNVLSPEEFLAGYRRLLDLHPKAWPVRYEDLYERFPEGLSRICEFFQLPDPGTDWTQRLPEITWMTGHVLGQHSASPQSHRREPDAAMKAALSHCEDYHLICERCNYAP